MCRLEVPTRAIRTTTSTSAMIHSHLGVVIEIDVGEDVRTVLAI